MTNTTANAPVGYNQPEQELLSQLALARLLTLRALAQDKPVHRKQAAIYACIVSHLMEHGQSPTIRQIKVAIGAGSNNTVAYHLDQLYEWGLLVHRQMCHGMTLSCWLAGHPVLGMVMHGEPRSCLGILEAELLQPSTAYVLLVADEALFALHYCAGDALIVEPEATTLRAGALVIAQPQGQDQPSLRLARVGDDGQLADLATQPSAAPCELSGACVQGVVTGMVRLYRQ